MDVIVLSQTYLNNEVACMHYNMFGRRGTARFSRFVSDMNIHELVFRKSGIRDIFAAIARLIALHSLNDRRDVG